MTLAVVGATGAVGREMLAVCQRLLPDVRLRLFASARSAGQSVAGLPVEAFAVSAVGDCAIALLAVGSDFARQYAPQLAARGCRVVDNSSAFRREPDVPLVCPLINPAAIGSASIVSNPNCSTLIAAVVLWPLHAAAGLQRVILSTYQAASGAGAAAMTELQTHSRRVLDGSPARCASFPHPLAFNLIPHIDAPQANGYTREEMKLVWELRRLLDMPALSVSATAVRVPIMRAHSESVTICTERPLSVDRARAVLEESPGVRVVDDLSANQYPMPLTATGCDDVEVGRIRQSLVFGKHGLDIFVVGDQLLRGAALNAVEIAREMLG